MKHTIVARLEDHPGALNRAVGLFRRRGFNIESLVVGPSEEAGFSRMTVVVNAGDVEPILKQLRRLVDVIDVRDVTGEHAVQRESAMLRVRALPAERSSLVGFCNAFGARILDVGAGGMVLEMSGDPGDVDRFLVLVAPFGIVELTRTGRIAMARSTGEETAAHPERATEPAASEHHTAGAYAG